MPNILVVDDDPDYIEVTSALLENQGYRVKSANNSDEAIIALREEKPDLVLLDIMMKDILDGLKVTYEMHDNNELYRIPIIVISSIASTTYAEYFPTDEYLHIDDWVSKPINPDVLLEKVIFYLQRAKH